MKANEAPEKLYLLQHNGLICYCMSNEDDIEYTRTDTFIERVCEFIETYPHLFMGVLRSEVINDFKNYIKGE